MCFKKCLMYIIYFFPLLLGGLIYISFRDENLLLFHWLRKLNVNYSLLRCFNADHNIIKSYVIYSLPNGLWVLSGILVIGSIWKDKKCNFYLYISILIFIALFIETAQKLNIMYGTFDVIDIFTIIIFSSIGIIIYIFRENYGKK